MGKQYQQRPSQLVGVNDAYSAYCLDESVYLFGMYVEAELHEATKDSTDAKKSSQQRHMVLARILGQDDIPDITPAVDPYATGDFIHDPTDPVSIETARTMPPAVKFTGRQFADPAKYFKKKQ